MFSLVNFIIPIFYLFVWYFIPFLLFGTENIDMYTLTLTALPVLFIGLLSKQTSWSVGGENGIKGDNIGKKIKASLDRRGSFEIDGYDIDNEKVDDIIKSISKNEPIRL